jgi:xanthine dehydrogenase accessory factor
MNFYSQLHKLILENKSAVLCIITHTSGSSPRKAGSKMIVFPDRKIIGTIGGGGIEFQAITDALDVLKSGIPLKKEYNLEDDLGMHCGGKVEVYFEPLRSLIDLYIFGAGHIGRVVARYALEFGFRITLFDEREAIFNEFDASPYRCVTGDYLSAIEKAEFTDSTFSVIVTPQHAYDESIVTQLGKKPFAYVGMIGSKRKVAEVKKNLMEKHGFTEEEISRLDMPIGIKFNAETPEEIAVSILAKLIDVKNSLNK